MKILIGASVLIIFISVIFVLFIITGITNKYLDCQRNEENKVICSIKEFGYPFIVGFIMMGIFVLIDVLVVYFLVKVITMPGSVGISGMHRRF